MRGHVIAPTTGWHYWLSVVRLYVLWVSLYQLGTVGVYLTCNHMDMLLYFDPITWDSYACGQAVGKYVHVIWLAGAKYTIRCQFIGCICCQPAMMWHFMRYVYFKLALCRCIFPALNYQCWLCRCEKVSHLRILLPCLSTLYVYS